MSSSFSNLGFSAALARERESCETKHRNHDCNHRQFGMVVGDASQILDQSEHLPQPHGQDPAWGGEVRAAGQISHYSGAA
jgi:hypothetical protein